MVDSRAEAYSGMGSDSGGQIVGQRTDSGAGQIPSEGQILGQWR